MMDSHISKYPSNKTEYKTCSYIEHTLLYGVASKNGESEDQWIKNSLLNISDLDPDLGAESTDKSKKDVCNKH